MEFKTHFEALEIGRNSLKATKTPGLCFRNITPEVAQAVALSKVMEGTVTVQAKHTTAGLIVNEDEPGITDHDIPSLLERLCPEGVYKHDSAERLRAMPAGEPENGADHVRNIIAGNPSITLVIHNASVQLGTWQAILFYDFDAENHPGRMVVIHVAGTLA